MTRIKPPSPQKIWRFSSAHFWNIKLYHFKVVNVALVWYNKFIVLGLLRRKEQRRLSERMDIMVRQALPQLSVFAFLYYRKYSIINISKDMRRQSDVRTTRCIMYK